MPRIVVPELIVSLFLGALFYAAFYLNVYLKVMPSSLSLYAIILSGILAAANLIVNLVRKRKVMINFEDDRIIVAEKEQRYINYNHITDIKEKKNVLDSIFGTSTILINNDFRLQYIRNSQQVMQYLQSLVNYSKQSMIRQEPYTQVK